MSARLLSDISNIAGLISDENAIALAFNRAITKNIPIEIDFSASNTKLVTYQKNVKVSEVSWNIEDKVLIIKAEDYNSTFYYNEAEVNTLPEDADKFYFSDDNVTITFIIKR